MENNKEIPADLTMLQPKKEPSFQEIFKNSKTPEQSTANTRPISIDEKAWEVSRGSSREGGVDAELDAFKGWNESINDVRARNQSEGIKGLKAVGSGLYQGALIAMEQLGYVADYNTYFNLFRDVEDLSGNWWTNAFKQAQEEGREYSMFKIYEEEGDPNDLASQIFKWSSLESAISSSVGFGITGLGAAKLMSSLGKLKQFAKIGQLTDMTLGMAGGSTQAFVGPLATSSMVNFFQGQMMATETYKDAMTMLKDNDAIGEGPGQLSMEDAQKLAANQAQEIVGLSMLMNVTAGLKFGRIFKRKAKLDTLVANPTAAYQIKELIKKGSPAEFFEEVYEETAQMEQLHDVATGAGIESEYSDNYWDRMASMVLSNRALHAGALGVVGGPLQFGIIQKPLMRQQIRDQREAYQNQQKTIPWRAFKEDSLEWHKELINNRINTFKEYENIATKALNSGDFNATKLAQDLSFIDEIEFAAQWGSLDAILNDIENIKNLTPEKAAEMGYDVDYSKTADSLISTINQAKAHQQTFASWANKSELIYNQLATSAIITDIENVNKDKEAHGGKFINELNILKVSTSNLDTETFTYKRDPNRFASLTPEQKSELLKKEKAEDELLEKEKRLSTNYSNWKKSNDLYEKRRKLKDKLQEQFLKLFTREREAQFAKEQEEKIKGEAIVKAAKDKSESSKSAKDAKIKKKEFVSQDVIVREGALASDAVKEKRAQRLKEWNAEKLETVSINQKETFTSIDLKTKKTRLFTKGDIVRSIDGREFKVLSQNTSSVLKGGVQRLENPILVEVAGKDRDIQVGHKLVLEDHSFLRPEVLQANVNKATGKYYYTGSVWGTYVTADSVLKPNNHVYQEAKKRRSYDSEAITPRNVEYQNNYAASLEPTEFAQEHDLSELNHVQYKEDAPIPVTIRREVKNGINYLNVYKDGVKINRLDRHANINYEAILTALDKASKDGNVSELEAEITAKYTSKANLVHLLDEEGKIIYHDLAEVKKMNKMYLPGGKLYIAQSIGDNSSETLKNTTISEDGETVDGNTLTYIDHNGVERQRTIPYSSMGVGYTYILLIDPDGKLFPLPLRAQKIGSLEAPEGYESYADLIIDDLFNTIKKVIPELENEEEFNTEEIRKIKETTDTESGQERKISAALQKVKKDLLFANDKLIKENLKETIYKYFRPHNFPYIKLHTAYGEEKLATEIVGRGKSVLSIDPNYFSIGFGISSKDTSNNISPYILSAHPTPNKFNKGIKKTYLSVEPEAFRELLNSRQRRISLREMMGLDSENGLTKAKAQDLIFNQGLQFDVNPAQPFAGTSLTIKVKDETVQKLGTKAADEFGDFLEYTDQDELTKALKEEKKEAVIQRLKGMLEANDESDYYSLTDIVDIESEESATTFLSSIIKESGLHRQAIVNSDMLKFMQEDNSTELESQINEMLSSIQAAGFQITKEDNLHTIKAVLFVQTLIDNISTGKYKVVYTPAELTNPEGVIFKKGVSVYNSVHGPGKISSVLKNKFILEIQVKERNNEGVEETKTKKVTAYPHQTFLHDSKYAELAKLQRRINKLVDPETPTYKNLKVLIEALERKLGITVAPKGAGVKAHEELKKIEPIESLVDTDILNNFKKFHNAYDPRTNTFLEDTKISKVFDKLGTASGIKFVDLSHRYQVLKQKMIEEKEAFLKTPITSDQRKLIPIRESLFEEIIELSKENILDADDFTALEELASKADVKQNNKFYLERVKAFKSAIKELKIPNGESVSYKQIIGKGPKVAKFKNLHKDSPFYEDTLEFIDNRSRFLFALFNLETEIKQVVNFKETIVAPVEIKSSPDKVKTSAEDFFSKGKTTQTAAPEDKKVSDPGPPKPQPSITKEPPLNPFSTQGDENPNSDSKYFSGVDASPELISAVEEWMELSEENMSKGIAVKAFAISYPHFLEKFAKKNNITSAKFKTVEASKKGTVLDNEQFQKELEDAKKMLPHIKFETLKTIQDMVKTFGVSAIGAYDKGVIYLVNKAEKSTAYHEVFHAVADLHLRPYEKQRIAEEYGHKIWSNELEEKVADDFSEYVKNRKSVLQKIKTATLNFFKSLVNWKKNVPSTKTVEKVFEKIASGQYANDDSLNYLSNLDLHKQNFNFKKFKASLIQEDAVTLQQLIDNNKIKIVC